MKTAPPPAGLSARMVPPIASMSRAQTARPRPVPLPGSFVVTKGSNTCPSSSGGDARTVVRDGDLDDLTAGREGVLARQARGLVETPAVRVVRERRVVPTSGARLRPGLVLAAARADRDRGVVPPVEHVHRVEQQVDEHLLELELVCNDRGQFGREVERDPDRLELALRAQQVDGAFDDGRDRDRRARASRGRA